MARMIPKVEAPAPDRTALPYGLFSVLAFPATAGDAGTADADRWRAAGVEFVGLPCEGARGVPGYDCDPEDADAQLIGVPESPTPTYGEGDSFDVYGWFACGPGSADEAGANALRHLLAGEEKRVEQAFWLGDLGNRPNLTNGLDEDTPITQGGTDLDPLSAIVELESWAAERGTQAILHTSRPLAVRLAAQGLIEAKNGKLVTKLGLPVVAGSGYADDGRIVATGALAGRRSEAEALDPSGYTFDPRSNDVVAQAVRSYVLWADSCGAYAVSVAAGGTP